MRIATFVRTTALILALVLSLCMVAGVYLVIQIYGTAPETPSDENSTESTGGASTRPPLIQNPGTTETQDPAGTEGPPRELTAQHAFVYDMASGELLMVKGNLRDRLFPASITKLFSAYVITQHLDLQQQITAGDALYLPAPDASVAQIKLGDVLTVEMLLEGMLIPSGNDAACILAVEVGRKLGGSHLSNVKAMAVFVEEMNRQAQLLGLTGTRFSNADGYHEELHYTTTEDLIKISKLVLEHPLLSRIVKEDSKTVTFVNGKREYWMASNFFVNSATEFYDPTCIGLKTGKTDVAGNCLLAAFRVNGRVLIIGVFGSPEVKDRFLDAQQILKDYL